MIAEISNQHDNIEEYLVIWGYVNYTLSENELQNSIDTGNDRLLTNICYKI